MSTFGHRFPPRSVWRGEPRGSHEDFAADIKQSLISCGEGDKISGYLSEVHVGMTDEVWTRALDRDFAHYEIETENDPDVLALLRTALPIAIAELRHNLMCYQRSLCALEIAQRKLAALDEARKPQ
jgi:hypothetical protein